MAFKNREQSPRYQSYLKALTRVKDVKKQKQKDFKKLNKPPKPPKPPKAPKTPKVITKKPKRVRKTQEEYYATAKLKRQQNREEYNRLQCEYRKNSPNRRIASNLRSNIGKYCLRKSKSGSLSTLMGCESSFLKSWLESQFKEGMTWDNYGKKGWHIDHIRPCSSYDLTDWRQQMVCFHYTNLQPMFAKDNQAKADKY